MPADILEQIEAAKNALPVGQGRLAAETDAMLKRARESAEALGALKALAGDFAKAEGDSAAILGRIVAGFKEYEGMVRRVAGATSALTAGNGTLGRAWEQTGAAGATAFAAVNAELVRSVTLAGTVVSQMRRLQNAFAATGRGAGRTEGTAGLIPAYRSGGQIRGKYRTGDRNLIRVNAGEWILNERQMDNLKRRLGASSASAVFRMAGGIPGRVQRDASGIPMAARGSDYAAIRSIAQAANAPIDAQQIQAQADRLTASRSSQDDYKAFANLLERLKYQQGANGSIGVGNSKRAELDDVVSRLQKIDDDLRRILSNGGDISDILSKLDDIAEAANNTELEEAIRRATFGIATEDIRIANRTQVRSDMETALRSLPAQQAEIARRLEEARNGGRSRRLETAPERIARDRAARAAVVASDVAQSEEVRRAAARTQRESEFEAEALSYFRDGAASGQEIHDIQMALAAWQNASNDADREAAKTRVEQLVELKKLQDGDDPAVTLGEALRSKFDDQVKDARNEFRRFAGGNVAGKGRFVAALAFAGKKVLEFADSLKGAMTSLAETEIAAAHSRAAFDGMAGGGEFDRLKTTLNFTRKEMMDFAETAREAVRKQGLSADLVETAARRVKDSFGVFDPQAMREIMNVLEKMTDSQARAMMGEAGDMAGARASVVANGNAAEVLALYDQGQLGKNGRTPTGVDKEKAMLDSVQKSERILEDIKTQISKLTSGIMGPLMAISNFAGSMGNVVSGITDASAYLKALGGDGPKWLGKLGGSLKLLGPLVGAVGGIATAFGEYKAVAMQAEEETKRARAALLAKQAAGTATLEDMRKVELAEKREKWQKIGSIVGGAIGVIGGLLLNLIPGIGTVLSAVVTPFLAKYGAKLGGMAGGKLAGGGDEGLTEEDLKNIEERVARGEAVVSRGNDRDRNFWEQLAAIQAFGEKREAFSARENNIFQSSKALSEALSRLGGSADRVAAGQERMLTSAFAAHRKEMEGYEARRKAVLQSNLDDDGRRQALEALDAEYAKITDSFVDKIEEVINSLDNFKNGLDYKAYGAAESAGNARADLAAENLSVSGGRRAGALILAGATGKAALERQNALAQLTAGRRAFAATRADLQEQLRGGRISRETYNTQMQAAQFGQVQLQAAVMEKLATAELERKRAVVKAADAEYNVRKKLLDFENERLDVQRDLMETIGAPAETVYALERQRVAQARQAAEIERERLDFLMANGASAAEIEQQKLALAKANADVVKKAYGAQNNALEKMLGQLVGAWGEISGVGEINNVAAVQGMGYTDYGNGVYGRGNQGYQGGYRDKAFGANALNSGSKSLGDKADETQEADLGGVIKVEEEIRDILKERLGTGGGGGKGAPSGQWGWQGATGGGNAGNGGSAGNGAAPAAGGGNAGNDEGNASGENAPQSPQQAERERRWQAASEAYDQRVEEGYQKRLETKGQEAAEEWKWRQNARKLRHLDDVVYHPERTAYIDKVQGHYNERIEAARSGGGSDEEIAKLERLRDNAVSFARQHDELFDNSNAASPQSPMQAGATAESSPYAAGGAYNPGNATAAGSTGNGFASRLGGTEAAQKVNVDVKVKLEFRNKELTGTVTDIVTDGKVAQQIVNAGMNAKK